MIYGIAGSDLAVRVLFEDPIGKPFLPVTLSAKYTVRGNDGTPDPDYTDVQIDLEPTDVSTVITLGSALTTTTERLETRTLIVSAMMSSGYPWSRSYVIRLTEFPRHSLEPNDVRSYIGVNASELPDADIDLTRAYLEAGKDVGYEELDDAFTTNPLVANDLVLYRAILNVFPSLELRIAQSESNGVKAFTRLTKVTLDRLYAYISGLYGGLVGTISGSDAPGVTLLVLSTQPDPITGV